MEDIKIENISKVEESNLNTKEFLEEIFTKESLKGLYKFVIFEEVENPTMNIQNSAWNYGTCGTIRGGLDETLVNGINVAYRLAKTKSEHIGIERFVVVVGNMHFKKSYGDMKTKDGRTKPAVKVDVDIPIKLRFIK